jgi:hypothetical protein
MEAIINDKKLNDDELQKEIKKVLTYKSTGNEMSFVGNKILYHFQMEELCNTKRKGKESLVEIFKDPIKVEKLRECVAKRNRTGTMENKIFECWRINTGCIAMFKMCNAVYLYKKYNAKKVLDPTAGWGGRMLGAINLGIEYTGIDTNINLFDGYDKMIKLFDCKCKMIYNSFEVIDFSTIDYDFVLTSPPYEDIEIYSHFNYENKEKYYKEFLIPLIDKSREHNRGEYTCINISPEMYKKLTLTYNYKECDIIEDLKEQKNGKVCDNIYIWKN